MDIEKMKSYIKGYCSGIGSCEKCILSEVENESGSCYTWCSDEEIIENYDRLMKWG